jgi:hypothetical protein
MTDRIRLIGHIVSIYRYPSDFNDEYCVKVLIQHKDGWRAFGTLPKSINKSKEGDEIELYATTKKSNSPNFYFFSRPTKAKFVYRYE